MSHLSPAQQAEVKPLLDPELFNETPGFTLLVQHKIRLMKNVPVRQKSYRIPERLIPVLQKKTKLMLELEIIEVSCSEWCSPIVLVPKKDGSLRFCIDFRWTLCYTLLPHEAVSLRTGAKETFRWLRVMTLRHRRSGNGQRTEVR